jgi:Concanavalin A-like lectin/glucanases superfamily
MPRRLLLLAIASGCGSVETPLPDATGDDLGTLRQGCAVMLRMDEPSWSGAGSVIDTCAGGHHGTPSGTITTTAEGVRGRAGRFQGNGCIMIPDAPDLRPASELTMSAWVLPTALNDIDAYGVISKRVDMTTQAAYSLYLWTENHAWVDLEGNTDRFANRTMLANNAWTQLTVVFDGTRAPDQRVRVYTNGTFDIAAAETAASITPHTSPLHIGCLPSPSAQTMQYFVGLIDEVAVWTRALSDVEIAQWYTATRPR